MSLAYIDPNIPRQNYRIDSVEELAEHFVMWEYAIAMCGYLMKVCPFDQPDVASAKAVVLDILREGQPAPDYEEAFTEEVNMGIVEVRQAPALSGCDDMRSSLYALFSSVQPGDFFALNAFLPFTGEGRREALESIRHDVAEAFGVVSCLEVGPRYLHSTGQLQKGGPNWFTGEGRREALESIRHDVAEAFGVVSCLEVGPRYLHSTGQLQKGGPNCGVFLILSADELKDIPLPQEAESLGALAKAQASGDLITLAERGRRCVHLHLPDNSGVTLRMLALVIRDIVADIIVDRALAEAEEEAEDAELEQARAEGAVNSGVTLRMLALVIRDIVADIIVDRALAEAEEEAEDAELEQARAEGAVIETAAVAPAEEEAARVAQPVAQVEQPAAQTASEED